MERESIGAESFNALHIEIENPKGSYKSFETEGDEMWGEYPLKGVTYPVDYGSISGYVGEDGAELDVFVGSGDLFGYIKVWRLDVPEETKVVARVTETEMHAIKQVFAPVLLTSDILSEDAFLKLVAEFKQA